MIPLSRLSRQVHLRPSGAPPACSCPIKLGTELEGCLPLAQGIPSFRILSQPIDFTQKVLLLLQVEVFHYFGNHWLLQLTPVVVGNRLVPDMLD
jgi:hypothetical protein